MRRTLDDIEDFGGRLRPVDQTAELSPLRTPDHLKERYARMVLITDARHIVARDEDTLYVTSSWSLWRACVTDKIHCLHIEWAQRAPVQHQNLEYGAFLKYMEWNQDGGEDITVFNGVSLGAYFFRQATMFGLGYDQLQSWVTFISAAFQVGEIVLRDIHTGYGMVSPEYRVRCLRNLSTELGVSFSDQSDPVPEPQTPWHPTPHRTHTVKDGIIAFIGFFVDLLFRLKWRMTGRLPTVFFLNNPNTVFGLLGRGGPVRPLILFRHWPKTWAFLTARWTQGDIVASLPHPRLSTDEKRRIASIVERLDRLHNRSGAALPDVVWDFLRPAIVEQNRFVEIARKAKGYRRLLQRWGVARTNLGDHGNSECRLIGETAQNLGIPNDVLLNGVFLTHQIDDVATRPSFISRFLVWSSRYADAVQRQFPDIQPIVAGYPALSQLGQSVPSHPGGQNWLILPCIADANDVRGLSSNEFAYTLEIAKHLVRDSQRRLKIKLHPGYAFKAAVYEKAIHDLGIECEVVTGASLADSLNWADHVVGPVNSGAFAETLAVGRPYYPVRPWPSSIDPMFFSDLLCFDTPHAVSAFVDSNETVAVRMLLQELTSSIDDPSEEFWARMTQDICPNGRQS